MMPFKARKWCSWGNLAITGGAALLYAVVAKIFLWFSLVGGNLTLIFPPSGIALAFLILYGRRAWLGILIGAFAANVWVGDPVPLAGIIAFGSTLQAVVGNRLLAAKGFDAALNRLDDYFKLIVWGGVASCIVAAFVGTTAIAMWGIAPWGNVPGLLLNWWMGDLLGVLLMTPSILVLRVRPDWFKLPLALEAALIFLTTLFYAQVTFLNSFAEVFGHLPKGFWLSPFVFFAAIRLGRQGVSLVMMMITALATLGAYQHVGYFAGDYAETGMINVWLYCMIYTIIGMSIAILMWEEKRLMATLERQAHIDYLTEVNNRGYFMELAGGEYARAIRYGSDLSILMLDVDHFKRINDSHGHKIGDTVLIKLAEVCKQALRSVDIIGRLGGEEFAVLLPETNRAVASEVAERLRRLVETNGVLTEEGISIDFTVSIGVASLESADSSVEILLNKADKALYQAKEAGRNQVCNAAE